jgi:hypothetical protein
VDEEVEVVKERSLLFTARDNVVVWIASEACSI